MYVMSIDPGTNYTGVSIWDIDDLNFNIKNIISFTIDLTDTEYTVATMRTIQRIHRLINILSYYIDMYQPYYLVIEAGFINIRRPTAYKPIANTIYAIETLFINKTNSYRIVEYSPKYVKQYVSIGDADKDDIKLAVSRISEITEFIDINSLSEHAIDSLAIGYTFIDTLRKYPEILLKG